MKIERFNMQGLVTDNARWVELVPNPEGSLCFYDQVPELEAKCAELEAKCAELETKGAELLEALEVILDEDMEDSKRAGYLGGFVLPDDLRQQARAAIAKAKGEEEEL